MTTVSSVGAEQRRLQEADGGVPRRRWAPYLSERQWGTVREDYRGWTGLVAVFPNLFAGLTSQDLLEHGLVGSRRTQPGQES